MTLVKCTQMAERIASAPLGSYPKTLKPTTTERIELPSGKVLRIAKSTPVFRPWIGKRIGENYGGKALLDFCGKPQFAELVILRLFEGEGWQGVWVDTYRKKYITHYWPRTE